MYLFNCFTVANRNKHIFYQYFIPDSLVNAVSKHFNIKFNSELVYHRDGFHPWLHKHHEYGDIVIK